MKFVLARHLLRSLSAGAWRFPEGDGTTPDSSRWNDSLVHYAARALLVHSAAFLWPWEQRSEDLELKPLAPSLIIWLRSASNASIKIRVGVGARNKSSTSSAGSPLPSPVLA